MAGVLIARASRTDIRAIRRGEDFLGIPFAKLKVGAYVEEQLPGKGKLVDGGKKPKRSRKAAKALGYPRDKLGNLYGPEKFDSDHLPSSEQVRRSHSPGWVENRLAKARASRLKREAVAKLPPKETPREGLMKRLADDPRFVKAKESGIAYIIVGAKPSVSKTKATDQARHDGDID